MKARHRQRRLTMVERWPMPDDNPYLAPRRVREPSWWKWLDALDSVVATLLTAGAGYLAYLAYLDLIGA